MPIKFIIIKYNAVFHLQDKILVVKRISLSKFNEGGALMLKILKRNQIIVNLGKRIIIPLFNRSLRLPERSYTQPTKKKRPEETRPCPTIIIRAPSNPINIIVLIPDNKIPI